MPVNHFEKIAKILHVDEVKVNHGPRGVAVHVRLEKSWRSVAIDNDDLEDRRLEVIAENLVRLADGSVDQLRKSMADAATRAAMRADAEAVRRFRPGGFSMSYVVSPDGPAQQQLSRSEDYAPAPTPLPSVPEAPAAESMPSRFHAIMAELRCL